MDTITRGHPTLIIVHRIRQNVKILHAQIMRQPHIQGLVNSVQTIPIHAKVQDVTIRQKL